MDDTNDQIQEAEVIEETVEVESPDSSSDVTVLLSLESMIKTHISRIDKLQDEARKHKDMVDSAFENSETYKQHLEAVKEATRVKNTTRQEIMKQPSMVALVNKLKGLQTELKEAQQELVDYLPEYIRLSGSNQIEGEDGEVREIIMVPKLVKALTAKNPRK